MAVEYADRTLLTKEAMDRVAARYDCTINLHRKAGRGTSVNLRHQKFPIYLGLLSKLEKLSEEEFAAKVAARLEKEYV